MIGSSGNMTIGGTLTQNGSDIKLKKEVRSVPTSQLDDVKQLQLKQWQWKDDAPGNPEVLARRTMGLIAQEAELVDAKLVYDVEPRNDEEESFKAIDHSVLIMKLLGAIQELESHYPLCSKEVQQNDFTTK